MDWNEAIFLGLSLADLLGLVFVAGTVWGIRLMSSPATAVRGNLIGAVSMTGAIIVTLVAEDIVSVQILWLGMAVGGALGYILAARVAMIEMPQMVALLNGFGGGSSAIVSLLTLLGPGAIGPFEKVTAILGLLVGAITLSGSLIAAGKLAGKINQRPVIFENQTFVNAVAIIISVAAGVRAVLAPADAALWPSVIALVASLAYGVLFTIRVGGADMPITVSLLNSLSGVAASVSGLAIRNPLLVAIGAVVGASGLILTQIMCRAMNRSVREEPSKRATLIDHGIYELIAGDYLCVVAGIACGESEYTSGFAQQIHGVHYLLIDALSSPCVCLLLETFHGNSGSNVAQSDHFGDEFLVEQRAIGERMKQLIRMLFSQTDQFILGNHGFPAGYYYKVNA
jgi:hypothetical protein